MIISSSAPRSLEDMEATLRALNSLAARPLPVWTVEFTPSYATRIIHSMFRS